MKNSYKKLFGSLLMFGAVAFTGCHQPDAEIDTLDYSRALQPLNFTAAVDRTTGCDVNFSWTIAENTDYVLSIQRLNEAGTADGSPIEKEIRGADLTGPYKVSLDYEKIYTATLQAFSATNPNLPGSLIVETGPVETYYVMESLSPELVSRTMNSIAVKWTNDEGDGTQLTKITAAPLDSKSTAETVSVTVTSEILAAQTVELAGLTPSTQYVVTLYYSKSSRGGVTTWTAPDTEGMTTVDSSEALMNALSGGAKEIAVQGGRTYDLDFGSSNPLLKWTSDLKMVGVLGDDGSMPVVKGFAMKITETKDPIDLLFENLVLEGKEGGEGVVVTFEPANELSVNSYVMRNCEVSKYGKGLVYRTSSTVKLNVSTLLFESLYVHDLNASGSGGAELFDLRSGTYGSFTLKNSTFIDAGRAFIFFDGSFSSAEIRNNTLNRVALTTGRKGLIAVRQAIPTFVLEKNLFLNEYSTSDNVRLIAEDANSQIPSMSGNYFYNINYNSKKEENYEGPDFFTTKIGDNASAVNQDMCLSGNGKILTSDPCVNSTRNKMQLTNSDVIAEQVGDPRWWTVEVPVTEIATELTPVSADYAWPLTNEDIFEPQEIVETIIYGNLRFIASSETFPVSITSDHTISFSDATSFTVDGEPTNNALAIRVSAAGSLLLTPSNAGFGVQMEVIAGSERYTVPCDGVEHTIGLGEITGDTHVYITTTGVVEILSLGWTTEVSVDGDVKALATPVVKAEPVSVAWGAKQDLVLSWNAVASAVNYTVTWGEQEPATVTEASLTIPASTVQTLAVGKYPVTVVAHPAETSTKYKDSAVGEAAFEVTKITLGTPEVTVSPSTVNAGTEQEVVVSWPAVADAEAYAVTFNSQTTTQSETTLTLSDADVAQLAAGRYEITVVAQKPSDPDHYADSAAGAGELEIYDPSTGGGTAYSWGDADFRTIYAAIGSVETFDASVLASISETADLKKNTDGITYKNLEFLLGGENSGKFKFKEGTNADGSKSMRFQFGGSGSLTKQCVSFTVDAAGTLVVEAASGSKEARPLVVNIDGVVQTKDMSADGAAARYEFDGSAAQAGSKIAIYSGNSGINIFSITWTPAKTVEKPTLTSTDIQTLWNTGFPTATKDTNIDISAITNMTTTAEITKSDDNESFSYKGFTFVANGGKFKFGTTNDRTRIQLGGAASAKDNMPSKQYVVFEAPGPGTLKIDAAGAVDRPLTVSDGTNLIGAQNTSDTIATYTYDCSSVAAGTKIYVYSTNSGINIASIIWE